MSGDFPRLESTRKRGVGKKSLNPERGPVDVTPRPPTFGPTSPEMAPAICRVALFILAVLTASGIEPSYETAWKFAAALEQDYAKERLNALVARCDSERMFQRMVRPLGGSEASDPKAKEAWEKFYWPAVVGDLKNLSSYETLFTDVIALVEGDRVIQFVLQKPDGMFLLLAVWLEARPDGKVVITDYRTMSQSLQATQRMRALVVHFSGDVGLASDDDELALAMEAKTSYAIRLALDDLGKGNPKVAFTRLLAVPDRVKQTRLWRDLRDGMAFMGYAPALENALKDSSINPVIALSHAHQRQNAAAKVNAFGALAHKSLHSPFARAMRANALLESGQTKEAFESARELYSLNSSLRVACYVAASAAARMRQDQDALAALQVWARTVPPKKIDESLSADPSLAQFRQSEGYRQWLKATEAVTVPAT
jgi:hypothetical protein